MLNGVTTWTFAGVDVRGAGQQPVVPQDLADRVARVGVQVVMEDGRERMRVQQLEVVLVEVVGQVDDSRPSQRPERLDDRAVATADRVGADHGGMGA